MLVIPNGIKLATHRSRRTSNASFRLYRRGDELGSAIIASRLVRDIINLCFLMERQYAPYPKWFGTAFKQLKCSDQLLPYLWTAQTATTWREREHAFNNAYKHLSNMHNGLKVTEKIPSDVSYFYDSPFKVMNGEVVARLIANQIVDADIKLVANKRLIMPKKKEDQ